MYISQDAMAVDSFVPCADPRLDAREMRGERIQTSYVASHTISDPDPRVLAYNPLRSARRERRETEKKGATQGSR